MSGLAQSGGNAVCAGIKRVRSPCRALSWFLGDFLLVSESNVRYSAALNVLNVSRRPRLPLHLFPGALG